MICHDCQKPVEEWLHGVGYCSTCYEYWRDVEADGKFGDENPEDDMVLCPMNVTIPKLRC